MQGGTPITGVLVAAAQPYTSKTGKTWRKLTIEAGGQRYEGASNDDAAFTVVEGSTISCVMVPGDRGTFLNKIDVLSGPQAPVTHAPPPTPIPGTVTAAPAPAASAAALPPSNVDVEARRIFVCGVLQRAAGAGHDAETWARMAEHLVKIFNTYLASDAAPLGKLGRPVQHTAGMSTPQDPFGDEL